MGRKGKSVYKYDSKGKLTAIYESVGAAMETEGVSRYGLYLAMERLQPVNGYIFSFAGTVPERKKKVILVRAEPRRPETFDDGHGFFDIDKWARACL